MRKKILEKRMARLKTRRDELKARALASTDVNEVRSINASLEDINAEIDETQEELNAIAADEAAEAARSAKQAAATPETRSAVPEGATQVNGGIVGTFQPAAQQTETRGQLEQMEYRQAFMAFVQNGTPIPMNLRAGDAISTTDTGAAIPSTVMNDVINTVRKKYGNLYNKVRKLSVSGGVEYPIGALKASFKWISESTVSPRQKVDALAKVSFSYHTAEIRISQTFLSKLLTLQAFERQLAEVIAVAYLQAMDDGIVNGSGNGCMLGILKDARITNTVTMTAAEFNDWTKWRKKFFSQLPLGYRAGEFIFPISTVENYLETMADSNNNPIFKQAADLTVDEANAGGRFFGRAISLVEPDILADFDTASAGDVVGVYWQPEEYAINENFGFTMTRYIDQESNEWVDKALVVVDGKVLNPTGFYKILKG